MQVSHMRQESKADVKQTPCSRTSSMSQCEKQNHRKNQKNMDEYLAILNSGNKSSRNKKSKQKKNHLNI